jgi:hypothetical protein
MAQDNESLERAILGALRSTIHDHGPITAKHVGSAAKRIIVQLTSLRGDGLARALRDRRFAGTTDAERSAEMKRRAALRRPKSIRSV